jgi:hypothetical protein
MSIEDCERFQALGSKGRPSLRLLPDLLEDRVEANGRLDIGLH